MGTLDGMRLTLAVVLLAALLTAGAARASGLAVAWYSFGDRYCSTPVDPVTVVFYGNATSARASNHLGFHTGWGTTILNGPTQWFATGGRCDPLDGQRADGWAIETRYHVRFRQSNTGDPTFGQVTVATPHFEDIRACGHAVRETAGGSSGYDLGRRRVAELMGGTHLTWSAYVGNSARLTQCDGEIAWSNGEVRFVQIPASVH